VCRRFPESYEDKAWAGTRWRVRKRTFAHVLDVESKEGLRTILIFRSSGPELDMLQHSGHPFFGAWASTIGMVIEPATDWEEVAELVTESYCLLAPKKLVALVDRPQ
jgi:hypothetical protein